MKNLKKLLALLLTVSMLTGLLGTAAFAAETTPVAEPENQEEVVPGPVEKEEEKEEAPSGETGAKNAANAENALPAPAVEEPEQTEAQKLQAAIDAAADGEETTITMTADIAGMTTAEIITIPAGKVIVLDMAGHSITVATDFAGRPFVNEGTLTVTGNGTIDSSASEGGVGAINNKGTLTIENGTFAGYKYGGGAAIRNTGADAYLTVNGGLFEKATGCIYNEGTAYLYGGTYMSDSCSACAKADGHEGTWGYALQNASADSKMYAYDGVSVTGTQGAISAAIGYLEVNGGHYKTRDCERNHGAIFYALYAAGEYGVVQCVVNNGTFETVGKYTAVLLGNDNTNGDGGINADAISHVYGGTFIAPENVPAIKVSPETAKASVIHGGSYTLLTEATQAYLDPATKTETKDGTTEVVARTADDEGNVAEAGGKYYTSLTDAIDAAASGQIVTMLEDAVELSVEAGDLIVEKTVTVDLNNKTLTVTHVGPNDIIVQNGGNLIIKNGTLEARDVASAANPVIEVTTGASVTLDKVTMTMTGKQNGVALYPRGDAAKVAVINGSTVTAPNAYAVSTNAGTVDNYNVIIELKDSKLIGNSPVLINVPSKMVIDNCEVMGGMHGVIVRGGTAEIKDSAISMSQGAGFENYFDTRDWGQGNMVNLAALTVGNKSSNAYQYPSDVVVKNTSLTSVGNYPAVFVHTNTTPGNGVSLDIADDCTITGEVVNNIVAEVNGIGYVTLQAAIDAADAGDTVTMLADYTEGEKPVVSGTRKLTLDLNGHTLAPNKGSGYVYGLRVMNSAELTVVNSKSTGGIKPVGDYTIGINVSHNAKLTVKGITIEAGVYGITGNGSKPDEEATTIVVDNCVIHATSPVQAIGIYHPQSGELTIKGGGEITGYTGIEMRGGNLTIEEGATVKIAGDYTYNGNYYGFASAPGGNGSVTYGLGVAIVPHTNRTIRVDIAGGTLEGWFALYEHNLMSPPGSVTLNVTGGEFKNIDREAQADSNRPFNATTEGFTSAAVKSVDCAGFISGGTFSSDVSAYVVEGSQANEETDGVWTIGPVDGSVAAIGIKGYPTLDAAFDALNAMPGSETVTMTILPGIHTPEAARKLLVTRDNVVIQGAGQYETMIDCKAIDVDGQAGVYIGASNVTLKDMTITTSGKNLDAVKVSYTNAAETQPLLKDIVLENLMLTSAAGHGLNLHGVDGVAVTNVKATGGKCGLSLANAKNVTVSDSALEGEWGSVGMMYKAENPNGTYNNPVELTLAGTNKLTGKIYSERPAHADTVTLATAQTADIYGAKVANSEQLTTALSAKIVDSEGKAAYYATLQAAIDAAVEGDTVTLLQDVTERIVISTDGITLDGNGKTITGVAGEHGVQVYCADNVTLKDLTVTGAGKSGLLVNASAVTVEGKLDLTGNGWDGRLNVGYGENITGTHSTSLTFAENATLTGVTTVYSDAGDVSRAGENENTITIGAVPGLVQVKGSADMPNCWTTAANAEAAAEAKTGETYYATLQEAVAAARAGGTVTLLKPVTLDAPMGNPAYASAILITKDLILDGGNNTITVAGEFHGIQASGSVDVTIKDLTVTGAGKDALLVNRGSNVTVENLTTSGNAWGAINVDHGSTLNFLGGSLSENTKIWTEDFEHCHITAVGLVEVHDLPNEDGKVHFLPETDARVIAKVGSVYYGSLAEAVAAADNGDTVTMVNDASGAGIIVNKSITIDFGGKTYTVAEAPLAGSTGTKTQAFQLLAGADKANPNTVTMKNGTIVLPSDNADLRMGIQNYTNLTLDGMTLDASGNSNITYVLSNNNGSTRITGGTTLKAAEGQVAFDVYDYSSNGYGDVSVAVDDADVSGKIEVSDSEKASLTITGGTYTVDVNAYCATGYVAPLANGTYTVKQRGAHSELTTNIGELEFVTGNAVEFTFTTKANGDAGVMVLGTSNFSEEEAIAKLEYKAGDQWLEYPRGGDFGPSTGFPMSDATSTFRVTFAQAGEYSFTASMKTVAGGKELCSTTVSFTVDAAVAQVGNTYYKSLTDAAASEESGAITLLADTSLNAPLTLDRDLILNADLRLDTGAQLALNGAVSGTGKLRLATEGGAPLTSSTSIKDYVASGIELTEGVEIIENQPAEGGYSYQLLAPVAQVGGVVYDSLQEAIDAAADGATVKLLVGTSLTDSARIPAGKTLTLDLNKKTLSAASGKDVLDSKGNLTITNGTISAQGRDAAAICANAGSVTLAANAKLTGYYGVYSEGAALTVNGEIEATNRAVYLKNAAATVGEGAQLSSSANGSYVFELSTNTTLNITGGTVRTGNGVIGSETSVVNVTGGTFASRSDHYFDGIAAENLTVTGGSFASDVGKYLSRDYLTLFENNMYTVTQGTLTIGQSSASLYPNDTVTLTVTPANAGGLTWTSSNTAVATVNNDGIVTAVAVGEATITATISNGSSVSCTVTVQNRPTPVIPGGGGGGGSTEIEDPDVPLAGVLPFEDVEETDWFYDGVYNVYFKDLMVGVSDTLFDPHGAITRGMIVSILYRLEGSPAVSGDAGFDDVPAGQWYTDGVTWAASHKIVEGYGDGSFQPNKSITREEFAAILYRYAGYKGYDTAVEESAVLNFTDAEDVSQYAVKALLWAVKHEMLNGMGDGTLAARGGATRAQAALIFTDFCSQFVDEAEEK